MCTKSKLALSAFVLVLMAWGVVAPTIGYADIVDPANVSIVTNGYYRPGYPDGGGADSYYNILNVFNGSGLTQLDANNQAAAWNSWFGCPSNYSDTTGGGYSLWQSIEIPSATAELVVDLGGLYALSGLRIWTGNMYPETGRGVYQGKVAYSTDGSTWGMATSFTLTEAPGDTTTVFGDSISKNGSNVRYVKFTNLVPFAGHYDPDPTYHGGYNDMISLSEIQFVTVPEPATTVMLVSGIAGLLAYAWRKRK